MDRYLLKNIIIIILVLANGFLLGSMSSRQVSTLRAQRETEAQLTALFSADNIILEEGAISHKDPPAMLSLSRDTQRERAAAAFFLGKGVLREDLGGGTYTYSSEIGAARFRSNGSFDIVGSLASENVEEFCRSFCKTFSYDDPVFSSNTEGTGRTGVAVSHHNKLPVFNCTVSFTIDNNNTLLTVSGTLLPVEGTIQATEQPPLSSSAALIAFQQMRRESFAVASAVTNTYPCYELQGSTASSLSLVPAWCVVTDASRYYVNCITGAVIS